MRHRLPDRLGRFDGIVAVDADRLVRGYSDLIRRSEQLESTGAGAFRQDKFQALEAHLPVGTSGWRGSA